MLPGLRRCQGRPEGLPRLLHEAAGALKDDKGRMPLVQVADVRFQFQGLEEPPSADAEEYLLGEPELLALSVKLARDPPMGGEVGRVVAVEEVEPRVAHPDLPGAHPDGIAGQGDLKAQQLTVRLAQGPYRELPGVVVREEGALGPVPVYGLPEIALLVEQADGYDGQPQVARRLELIAGDVAEAAGVNGERLAQHVFHAEIGDAAELLPSGGFAGTRRGSRRRAAWLRGARR